MIKQSILITILAALAACGGGGNDGDNGGDVSKVIKVGVIEQLAGVSYRTPTQSGTLSSSGEFNYIAGESLTLLLGDMVITELESAADSSLVELLGLKDLPSEPLKVRNLLRMPEYTRDRIQTGYLVTHTQGTYNTLHNRSNLMRLLIALDNDNDPTNGFDITANKAAVADLALNLDVSLYEFATNDDALAFQHTSGISLAMDVARPLRVAYELADLDLTVPERVKQGNIDFTYSALGQLASRSQEQTSDSVTKTQYTYSSDNGGIETETLTINPNSDESDYSPYLRVITNAYNDFGLLATARSDLYERSNVTELDYYNIQTNSYLDNKVYLTTERTVRYADAAGTVSNSRSIRNTFNDAYQHTSSSTFSGATTEQEVFEYGNTNYVYDEQGRLALLEDENTNSNSLSRYDFTYTQSEEGLIATRIYTRNNGPKVAIKETIDSGVLTAKETKNIDSEGLVTSIYTMAYSYDDQARISQCLYQKDNDASGSIDTITTSVFTYSDAGLSQIKNNYDNDADGTDDSQLIKQVEFGSDGEVLTTLTGDSYTYGNAAQNGISYLIYEYLSSNIGGDANLYFYDSQVKCENASVDAGA